MLCKDQEFGRGLPEKFECRFNSKGTVPPWVAGCVAHVLSRPEKRNDDHNVRVRLKMRKRRDALTQDGGEADPGDERGGTTTLDPGRVTGTSVDRTNAIGERPSQRCTASEQWQRAQELGKIGEEADDGSQEEVHLKVLHSKKR